MFSSTKQFQRALFTNNNSVKFAFDEKSAKRVLSRVNTLQWTSNEASVHNSRLHLKTLGVFHKRRLCNKSPCRTEDLPFVSSFQGRSGDLATCFSSCEYEWIAKRHEVILTGHPAFKLISTRVLPVSDDVNATGCTNCERQIRNTISTVTKNGQGVGWQSQNINCSASPAAISN